MMWKIYVGTFAEQFFSMRFDPDTLEASDLRTIPNPFHRSAFFALSSDGKTMYTANEFQKGPGGIAAFRLNGEDDPTFLNARESNSQGPAHISLLRAYDRDFVLGSGFFEGDVIVCPTAEDGSLMPISEKITLALFVYS